MKVMLAATIDSIEQLKGKYPLLGSPKLDGIRAVIIDGVVYSRNMKPIPNAFVQKSLPLRAMDGWDGELIVGAPTAPDCFRVTTSGVMSASGEPDFVFYVFDTVHKYAPSLKFIERFMGLKSNVKMLNNKRVKLVPQVDLKDPFAVHNYEELMLERGFEGVMLRTKGAAYKHGRSTIREGALMKLKQFSDSEAVITGFQERMHNGNVKTTDELGRSKRSSHKANLRPIGTLGALHVRDLSNGVCFDVGTGFDDTLRAEIWANRKMHLGAVIKYKFFPTGSKDKPRFPVFIGFRDENDIS